MNELFDKLQKKKYDEVSTFISEHLDLDYNIKNETDTYLISYIIAVNNLELLDKILQTNVKLDILDPDNRSILYVPIKYNFIEIVVRLLKHEKTVIGMPIYAMEDGYKQIALHYAIIFKNLECIKLLLPLSNLSAIDDRKDSIVHMAVKTRNFDIIKLIIQNAPNLNAKNLYGETCLHVACRLSLYETVKFLMTQKIDIDCQEYEIYSTALHMACFSGNDNIVKLLLEKNADPNMQDITGATPLHICTKFKKITILHTLLSNKNSQKTIDANIVDESLNTPLHILLEDDISYNNIVDYAPYFELLIPLTNLNMTNKTGNTCLHGLCKSTIWKTFEKLLETKKLNIIVQNFQHIRPIDIIPEIDKPSFIELAVKSYVHTLITNNKKIWPTNWENKCSNNIIDCTKYAREKIMKLISDPPQNNKHCEIASFPKKKSTKNSQCGKIHIDVGKQTYLSTFTGLIIDVLCGFSYLTNKHKSLISISSHFDISDSLACKFSNEFSIKDRDCHFLTYCIISAGKSLFIHPNLKNIIQQCLDTKNEYIVVYLIIVINDNMSHANILLYSKKTNEIERFDPMGYAPYIRNDGAYLDNKLDTYFSNVIKNSKYVRQKEYMSNIGMQKIELTEPYNTYIGDPLGFCAVWSIWYVDMRLSYPDVQRKKLIKYITQQFTNQQLYYRTVIRNYSKNITDLRDSIFNKVNININIWKNYEYTVNEFDTFISELKKNQK